MFSVWNIHMKGSALFLGPYTNVSKFEILTITLYKRSASPHA